VLESTQLTLLQDSPNTFKAKDDPRLTITYQDVKHINWMRIDESGRTALRRIPDITISYGREHIAYVDAKCVDYSSGEIDFKGRLVISCVHIMSTRV
jgi:hypothetical protein